MNDFLTNKQRKDTIDKFAEKYIRMQSKRWIVAGSMMYYHWLAGVMPSDVIPSGSLDNSLTFNHLKRMINKTP